jgi:succinate dehydrogenase / fumarate reductase flavoprotein subunit
MSESLRNDGRIWVPKKIEDAQAIQRGEKTANDVAEEDRDFYLERRYPAFGNLVPRDVASRAAKERCDAGYGVNGTGEAVYLDFKYAIERLGKKRVEGQYGNLFQMYEKIADEDPYQMPMKIYPAVHYTMGGIWVDYELMTTVEGLFAAGEANFSDHGANRLGASALMQGLADGYFVIPNTVGNYLSNDIRTGEIPTDTPEFEKAEKAVQERINALIDNNGTKSVDFFHKQLGTVMWENCGMSRNAEGLNKAIVEIKKIRDAFHKDVRVPGVANGTNQELEKALRVADFLELGELMCRDALMREESCGGHFREESVEVGGEQDGEAKRDDENFAFVGTWEFNGVDKEPTLHKEELNYENIKMTQRSYK